MVSAYAIPRYLLEIYKTDEENFEPYVPNTSNNEEESVKDKVKEEGNKETDEEHMMLKKTKMVSHFIKEKSKKFIITEIYIL